jgi:hypothetical protein
MRIGHEGWIDGTTVSYSPGALDIEDDVGDAYDIV